MNSRDRSIFHQQVDDRRRRVMRVLLGFALAFLGNLSAWSQQINAGFDHLSIKQGLSQKSASVVYQDRRGFLWVGTQDGLNRYDGYEFVVYKNDPTQSDTISSNWVRTICEDHQGRLWFGTRDGLNRHNPETGRFESFFANTEEPELGPAGNHIRTIYEDSQNRLWIGSTKGLSLFHQDTGRFTHFTHQEGDDNTLSGNHIQVITEDSDGRLWIGTETGLNFFKPELHKNTSFTHQPGNPNSLIAASVLDIYEAQNGKLMIGTDKGITLFDTRLVKFQSLTTENSELKHNHILAFASGGVDKVWIGSFGGGLMLYHLADGHIEHFPNDPLDPDSLANDFIRDLTLDDSGVLWISNDGGLDKYDGNRQRFAHVKYADQERSERLILDVQSIYESTNHTLWIGTTKDGLARYHADTNTFEIYSHDEHDDASIGGNGILDIDQTPDGALWLATKKGGLNRMDVATGRFERFTHDPKRKDSVVKGSLWSILIEDESTLWVAGYGGLAKMNIPTGTFQRLGDVDEDPNQPAARGVTYLMKDRKSFMWAGTLASGLCRLNPSTNQFEVFKNHPAQLDSISDDRIWAVHEDDSGAIWVGTPRGLNRFLPGKAAFKTYREKDGLPNDVVYAILHDKQGQLWISTNNGLSRFNPATETFRNYTWNDGLQSDEFNFNAAAQLRDGRLIFGGINGYNAFVPEQIQDDPTPPKVQLTDFLLLNKSVPLKDQDPKSPLEKTVGYTQKVTLDYRDDIFSLEFAGLHYSAPEKNRYAYKLEGLNHEWVETSANHRIATFTNLDAGRYTFRVKAANKDGVWSPDQAALQIHVLPPPWLSWWAYTIYALLAMGALVLYNYIHQRQLEKERETNRKLMQVDKIKDQFLANTSHELKTPLNGIIGLAESLLDGAAGPINQVMQRNLSMVVNSGKRLGSLVNDILDFSELKNDKLELRRGPVNLHQMVEAVFALSKPLVGDKKLALKNATPTDCPLVDADEDRLLQIMHNLVGNAVKFTERGHVQISAEVGADQIMIHVADTGIGIPEDKVDRIFESFEQAEESTTRRYGGSGLGLSITRQLIERHGGKITVRTVPGEGSTFMFSLPLFKGDPAKAPKREGSISRLRIPNFDDAAVTEAVHASRIETTNFKILVVDDEPVNRQVLVNHLATRDYNLYEAADGFEALEAIREQRFDLILLDVMMPRLDGYEVCRRLRDTFSMRELPVIFLTAKNGVADLVEGFAAGANDYLTKPIIKGELLSRVETHLELLDFNRDLEQKVRDRTRELRRKNHELDTRNRELETIDRIVKTINREMELKNVIAALLNQGLALLNHAERAFFLLYDTEKSHFRFLASAGLDYERLRGIELSRDELMDFFRENMEQMQDGLYHGHDLKTLFGLEKLRHLRVPRSQIALDVPLNDQVAGYLIIDNFSDPDAFQQSDAANLVRLREHAVSAVSKALVLKELAGTQKELVETAHQAGMAEIATNVLHHVGNTLNSVTTSLHVLQDECENRRWQSLLEKISTMMTDQQNNLADYFANDPRSAKVPEALTKINAGIKKKEDYYQSEILKLADHIRDIVAVLQEQQKYTHVHQSEWVDPNRLVQNTLEIEAQLLRDMKIEVFESFSPLPLVHLEKSKFTHILIYLLKNAWEAILLNKESEPGRIYLSTNMIENEVEISIVDNGIGIPQTHMSKIFGQGFTTKGQNRGFGLHYCANAMHEMSGRIWIESEGPGHGARVFLRFPVDEKITPRDDDFGDHGSSTGSFDAFDDDMPPRKDLGYKSIMALKICSRQGLLFDC